MESSKKLLERIQLLEAQNKRLQNSVATLEKKLKTVGSLEGEVRKLRSDVDTLEDDVGHALHKLRDL